MQLRFSRADRWAIVAYIRALQLSQQASINDVPAGVARPTGRRQMMANAVDYSITPQLRTDLRQWRTRALIAGVVGRVVSAVGILHRRTDAVLPLVSLVVHVRRRPDAGPLAWLMLQYVTGGAWGLVIRRSCEAATRTLPLVAG